VQGGAQPDGVQGVGVDGQRNKRRKDSNRRGARSNRRYVAVVESLRDGVEKQLGAEDARRELENDEYEVKAPIMDSGRRGMGKNAVRSGPRECKETGQWPSRKHPGMVWMAKSSGDAKTEDKMGDHKGARGGDSGGPSVHGDDDSCSVASSDSGDSGEEDDSELPSSLELDADCKHRKIKKNVIPINSDNCGSSISRAVNLMLGTRAKVPMPVVVNEISIAEFTDLCEKCRHRTKFIPRFSKAKQPSYLKMLKTWMKTGDLSGTVEDGVIIPVAFCEIADADVRPNSERPVKLAEEKHVYYYCEYVNFRTAVIENLILTMEGFDECDKATVAISDEQKSLNLTNLAMKMVSPAFNGPSIVKAMAYAGTVRIASVYATKRSATLMDFLQGVPRWLVLLWVLVIVLVSVSSHHLGTPNPILLLGRIFVALIRGSLYSMQSGWYHLAVRLLSQTYDTLRLVLWVVSTGLVAAGLRWWVQP